jgi:tetratricopeptide (TPR) repeat protein
MNRFSIQRLLASAAVLSTLAGCAGLPHFSHWVKIRPIAPSGSQQASRRDSYYASATAAIGRRDYAEALELLQAARERKADDVRVLNAFGVVYDKLGRFDLSERYYARAKALDPNSSIVANNIAYSTAMRRRAAVWSVDDAPVSFARAATPTPPLELAQAPAANRPAVLRLGFAQSSATPVVTLALAGRALEIANASGRKDGAEPVRQELARLGWSSPKQAARAPRREASTTITYPARSLAVARALARTLPAGVQLVDCGAGCDGVRLVIGADSASWTLKSRTGQALRND